MRNEDIESILCPLKTKSPPPELRDRILRGAMERLAFRRERRRAFLPKLALACSILLLMLADISIEGIQGARIARLTGGAAVVARGSAQPVPVSLAAMYARRMAYASFLEGTGLP